MAKYSPAALRLMGAGVTTRAIAGGLGVSHPSVVYWLRGQRTRLDDERVREVIAGLGGQGLADDVCQLVEEARAEADEEDQAA